MGLDMYLTKKIYVSATEDARKKFVISIPNVKVNAQKISAIHEDAAYWRKANAIHGWFVENVQAGVDDCGEYWVSDEKLKELLKVCKKVLRNRTKASEILPVKQGFFFGDDKYHKNYFDDLKYTKKIIEDILKDSDYHSYYYSSSW